MKRNADKCGMVPVAGKGALFSECEQYRYVLWRCWDMENHGSVAFVALNPSTATSLDDDPTVRRCINFAKDWGAGRMYMLNAFAYRATDPDHMKNEINPVGSHNDWYISQIASQADITVICWGSHGKHDSRDADLLDLLNDHDIKPWCLGWNKGMTPKHPLYLSADLVPRPYYSFNQYSDHHYIQNIWEQKRENYFS